MKEKNNRQKPTDKLAKADVESVKSQFKNGKSRIKLATAPKVQCLRAVNPERNYERIMNE